MNSSMSSPILCRTVCDKSQHKVKYLVAGDRINICSECVAWYDELIEERKMNELFQIPTANDPDY